MANARGKVFGPVPLVLTVCNLEEAVALTNDATYGLSAGVWSENIHICLGFPQGVQAGTIWTNTLMGGFPDMTFSGIKQSCLGRKIGSYTLDEFMEVKTVAMPVGRPRTNWVRD